MQKFFIVILALLFLYVSGTLYNTNQGYTYSEEFKAHYKFVNVKSHAYYCNLYCIEEGGKLFYPGSIEEAIFAYNIVPKDITEIYIGVGGSPRDNFTNLYDVDGNNASYLRTFSSLNKTPIHYYVTMKSYDEYAYVDWWDLFPFICKRSIKTQQLSDDKLLQLTNDGYIYKKSFNALYKYKKVQVSYAGENIFCNIDGGSTFLPESKEETSILQDMGITGLTFVGISKYYHSDFRTIDGNSIYITYADWAENEPKWDKNHVAIDNSGKYYAVDEAKDQIDGYICKVKLSASIGAEAETSKSKSNSEFSMPRVREDEPIISKFFGPLESVTSEDSTLKGEFDTKKYKYLEEFNTYYKIFDESFNSLWTAALICSSDNSDLFYPQSEEEAREIFKFIPQEVDKIWIGITISSGKFHTLTDGLAINFNVTENSNTGHGIVLNRNLTYENVNHEKGQYAFVCKKELKTQMLTTVSDIEKAKLMIYGYNLYQEFDAWYKHYHVNKTFEFAFIQCAFDRATLFVPETKRELEEIIQDMEISDTIWIGMTKLLRNYFVTVKGQLASDYYYKWARDQPELQYDFVAFNKTGRYFSTSKFHEYSFICKK